MRNSLVALFVALLMAGCGGPDLDDKETLDGIIAEAIDKDKLKWRVEEGEELAYAPHQQTPYSGWMRDMHDKGQIMSLGQFKDGKLEGQWAGWYSNRQKAVEETWKDGKLVTAVAWKPNGEKCPVTNLVDGNGVYVQYGDDGTETYRRTYKDAEIVD